MANDMHDERRDPAQASEEAAEAVQAGVGEADALAPLVAERDELKDRVLRTLARWRTCAGAPSARWPTPAPTR